LHAKVRLAATAVAVAANPIQLGPASTAWLAVAAAVRAAMGVAVVVDLAEAMAVVVAAEVAVATAAAMVVATVVVADLSDADQVFISNSLACDRLWPGHRTSCRGCAVHGAWSPCPAFWRATF
jgi:positive regulator of sigma E activity